MLNIGTKVRAIWLDDVSFIGEITDFAYEHDSGTSPAFGPYLFVVPTDEDSVPEGLRQGVYVKLENAVSVRAPLINTEKAYDPNHCEFCNKEFKHYNHAVNHYAKHHDTAI